MGESPCCPRPPLSDGESPLGLYPLVAAAFAARHTSQPCSPSKAAAMQLKNLFHCSRTDFTGRTCKTSLEWSIWAKEYSLIWGIDSKRKNLSTLIQHKSKKSGADTTVTDPTEVHTIPLVQKCRMTSEGQLLRHEKYFFRTYYGSRVDHSLE